MTRRPRLPNEISKLTWDYEKIRQLARSQFTTTQIAQYLGIDRNVFRDRLESDPVLREVLYTARLGVIDEVASAVIYCATEKNDRDAQKILLRKAGWFNDVTKSKMLQIRNKELELKCEEMQLKMLGLMSPEQIEEQAQKLIQEQSDLKKQKVTL